MRSLGLILITIGFIGGALVAVMEPDHVEWMWFVPFLAIGAAGVAVVQIAMRKEATQAGRLETNFQKLETTLGRIVTKVSELDETKSAIEVYDLPAAIDRLFPDDINAFVEVRESIAHLWGTQAYADIMSHFAAGERYLNRVWSSAADGYIDEAHDYVGRSHEQFAEALRRLEELGRARADDAAS